MGHVWAHIEAAVEVYTSKLSLFSHLFLLEFKKNIFCTLRCNIRLKTIFKPYIWFLSESIFEVQRAELSWSLSS